MGVQLFDRTGYRAVLTPIGKTLLEEGRYLLNRTAALESSIQRLNAGWETEICIAYDDIIPFSKLIPLIGEFGRNCPGVKLTLSREVLAGCWDSLITGVADLVIGVNGKTPDSIGISMMPLGRVPFAFVASPDHPLARVVDPLTDSDISQHRVIAVADTARSLPKGRAGILDGQEVLTVPTFESKVAAILGGLGVGNLPLLWADEHIKAGRLIVKSRQRDVHASVVSIAWKTESAGSAMQWLISYLRGEDIRASLLRR